MTPSRTFGAVKVASVFPIALVAILVVGCSGGKDPESAAITLPNATKSTAPECQIATDGTNAITESCQDILFVSGVRDGDFEVLDDVDDKKLVGFVRGLCAYASTMEGKDASEMPLFGDLLASTSNSWGVSVEAVEAIYDASQMLCPDGYELMTKMPRAEGGLQVQLRATGEGSAKISYLLPHGAVQEEETVDLPWSQTLYVPEAMSLSITVSPIDGSKAGCQIVYGQTVLDEERVAGETANCDALSKDVDRVIAETMGSGAGDDANTHNGKGVGSDSQKGGERD